MAFEIENKYRVADLAGFQSRAEALGCEFSGPVPNEDLYLNHPKRDFAASGEAFRVRREGDAVKLTYKGPKLGSEVKTREEIEIEVGSGDAAVGSFRQLFQRLSFVEVAYVRKERRSAEIERAGRTLHVTLDRAEELGDFVEIETIANDEGDLPAAQWAVQGLAAELGVFDVEPRSYLRMLLEKRGLLPG